MHYGSIFRELLPELLFVQETVRNIAHFIATLLEVWKFHSGNRSLVPKYQV